VLVCGCDMVCWDSGRIWCCGDVCWCVGVACHVLGSGMIWTEDLNGVQVFLSCGRAVCSNISDEHTAFIFRI
jgi:hypothetical protein